MENSVEALYMAAAVLIFMLALTLTLSSFSTFRNDLEDLILSKEKVDTATTKDENGKTKYINYISSSDEKRTVGIDTVSNSLYRVYKENYTVVIKLGNGNSTNYEKFNSGKDLENYANCLKNGATVVKEQKYKSSGDQIINSNDYILVFDIPTAQNDKEYINNALKAGLYELLKDKTFIEYTGVYYEADTYPLGESDPSRDPSYSGDHVSDANKKESRVITYIEKINN